MCSILIHAHYIVQSYFYSCFFSESEIAMFWHSKCDST